LLRHRRAAWAAWAAAIGRTQAAADHSAARGDRLPDPATDVNLDEPENGTSRHANHMAGEVT